MLATLCGIVVAVFGSIVFAQTTAQLNGTVIDASGAAVSGATVTVFNVATGLERRGTANDMGLYALPLLPAGEYRVTVQRDGFRQVTRTGVRLTADQVARLDFTLELGSVSETIEVVGSAGALQTETSTISTLVDKRAVAELPLVSAVSGRDPVELLQVLPGSTNRGVAGTQSINGGRVGTNDIQVDGATKVEELIGNSSGAGGIPSVETVNEVKLVTNVYSAEFGRSGGASVIVTTKSGTNQIHGSAYHFFRHDKLAARNFFAPTKLPIRSNQPGFTVGGPIVRNRTFFFGSYEGWRFRTDFNQRATVPTELEKQGDFTDTRNAAGNLIRIYDPTTLRPNPNGTGFIRDPFPGNQIPAARIDPVGRALAAFYEPGNLPGAAFTRVNNFRVFDSGGRDFDQAMVKIDHSFSTRNTISGKYFWQELNQKQPIVFNNPFNPGNNNQHAPNHHVTVQDIHILSSRLLNEFRAGLNRHINAFEPKFPVDGPALIGLRGLPSPAPTTTRVNVTGFSSLGNQQFGGTYQTILEFADTLAFTTGRHTMKFGVDFRRFHFNRRARAGEPGSVNFTGVFSNLPGQAASGSPFADLLLGAANAGSVTITPTFGLRSWYAAGFFQDDIKITPTFTLNVGLRWDAESPFTEVADRMSAFDPTLIDPVTGLPGALRFAGRDGASRSLVNLDRNNIGPRIGFAWSPRRNGSTVFRGGYGIIYSPLSRGAVTTPTLNAGFSATTSFASLDALNPAFFLTQGFPFHNLPDPDPPLSFQTGQDVNYINPNNRVPYVQQWSFDVQRELGGGFVLSTAYVGNKGTKLPWGSAINLNQLPSQMLGNAALQRVANPFAQTLRGSLGGTTVTQGQLLRAYPQYLNVLNQGEASASSSYHSLQTKLEKPLSSGVYLITSYTWSKLMTDSPTGSGGVGGIGVGLQDSFNRRAEKGPSTNDLQHRFVSAVLYELPFGKGKRFAQGRVANMVAGGWQVNTIVTAQSGMPLTMTNTPNLTQSLGGGSRPDRICNGTLESSEQSIARYFDTSCFVAPGQFRFGNSGTGVLRGPGIFNTDFSAFKNISITDRVGLQFRAEFFNVLNHTNFGNPGTTRGVGTFGVIAATAGGTLDPMGGPRITQFGLKVVF